MPIRSARLLAAAAAAAVFAWALPQEAHAQGAAAGKKKTEGCMVSYDGTGKLVVKDEKTNKDVIFAVKQASSVLDKEGTVATKNGRKATLADLEVNRPLIVNPEAEADLADARAWYDGQRAGLGDVLLTRVEEIFARIQRTPELFGKVFQELRLARVRRFPYVVVYRIDEDQITVVAIYHTSRDPRGWHRRA